MTSVLNEIFPASRVAGIIWLPALLMFLALNGVRAQEKNDPAADFAEAVEVYSQDLGDLRRRRGVPSEAEIRAVLARRGELVRPRWADYDAPLVTSILKENFQPGTGLLFYFHSAGQLRVWLLDGTGIQGSHHQPATAAELGEAMSELRRTLGVDALSLGRAPQAKRALAPKVPTPAPSAPDFAALKPAIARMTALLLPPPIARRLDSFQHLVVVPSAVGIGTVPFALLQPFNSEKYLIEQSTITIAPSLYDLETGAAGKWDAKFLRPLVVGDPLLLPDPDYTFPPLPGAREESAAIAKLLNAVPLIGDAATKEVVIKRAAEADLLYFATHGVASAEDPLGGGFLALSGDDSPTTGRWTVREVLRSRLRARLAVLSACQTGLGQAHAAGVIGLARGFQLAGVPRVAMSLWSVDDKATSQLMQAFVRRLQQQPPAAALRQAMLDQLAVPQSRTDPAKWASFVIFGTPN